MNRNTISLAAIGLLLGGGLFIASRPILAGEHFLAIDVPKGLQAQIEHRQNAIKGQLKKKNIHVRYHPKDNLHISLMRFEHIPDNKLSAYQNAIKTAVKKSHLHRFNMADKIDHAALEVWPNGYIVYRLKPSKKLTTFMHAVTSELTKKHLPHGAPDTPDTLHISIARVDNLSVDDFNKLKKLLEGNVNPLKKSSFSIHKIQLKVSNAPKKPLTYTTTKGGTFDIPKAKLLKTKKLKTKK